MRYATGIVLMTLALATPALAVDDIQNHRFDAAGVKLVRVDHPVGELEIIGADVNAVEVRMEIDCDGRNCAERIDDIRLEGRTKNGELHLEVDGYPRFGKGVSVNLELRVPRSVALAVEHGVGETSIDGVAGDIELEAGVGEVEIRGSSAAFHSAEIELGVGESELSVDGATIDGDSFLFVGGETEWHKGRGESRLKVEVGVGEVSVRLD
ncbi:MAG: hypothetical protein NDJ92_06055 [Thermoanaerobaculia bacterium]|nr:hypothetical protein [Thermoanaerobaculia bacterium]